MSAAIISTGSYRALRKVTNYDLENIMDTSHAWIEQRTGIVSRFYEDDSNLHMAYHASINALKDIDLESIDGIIVGTYTPDNLIPGVAASLRHKLGITRNVYAFDVNAACSGFIFALHTAYAYIKSGMSKRILVVGVDYNTRILDFEDRATSILFGDGAGAVVLEASDVGIIDSFIHNESDVSNSLSAVSMSDFNHPYHAREARHPYFQMEGRAVFKFAVKALKDSVLKLVRDNNLDLSDVDYIVSHQANLRILEMASKSLKIPIDKFLVNVDVVGNTSSGSVPLLLDEENQKETFKKGMKIIMVAFGGGLTYGATLVEWT